jgi:hypothetical protein
LSEFLTWYRRSKRGPKILEMALGSAPKNAGRKPSTRKKTNKKKPRITEVVDLLEEVTADPVATPSQIPPVALRVSQTSILFQHFKYLPWCLVVALTILSSVQQINLQWCMGSPKLLCSTYRIKHMYLPRFLVPIKLLNNKCTSQVHKTIHLGSDGLWEQRYHTVMGVEGTSTILHKLPLTI